MEQNQGNGNKRCGHGNNNNNGRNRNRDNNNIFSNRNNHNNNMNNSGNREEAYQQKSTQDGTTRSNTNSYYSDKEDCKEHNMMKACMKCHKPNEDAEVKNKKPQSCAIIVSVKKTVGRQNCLTLVDTGSLSLKFNIVSDCY